MPLSRSQHPSGARVPHSYCVSSYRQRPNIPVDVLHWANAVPMLAGPNVSIEIRIFYWLWLLSWLIRLWLENQTYRVRIPAWWGVWHWGCAFTVLQTVQMYGNAYGTVHYKELLNHSAREEHQNVLIFRDFIQKKLKSEFVIIHNMNSRTGSD